MKIAVDWDETLDNEKCQELVKELIKLGHEIEIVTTRYENPSRYSWYNELEHKHLHEQLLSFAEEHDLRVHFTNFEYKAKYLEENNFDVLLDNNDEEEKGLKKCKFVLYHWARTNERILKEILKYETKDSNL